MSRFLETPHLPSGRVEAAAIGEDYAPLLAPALAAYGVRVLVCPGNPDVDPRLRSHIDLSVLHLGGARFVLAAYLKGTAFSNELRRLGAQIVYARDSVGPLCPADARLCALVLGDRLFHAPGVTDAAVLQNASQRFVPVRQSYAKCAVCPVAPDEAVTADEGLARALRAEGITVFPLAPGGVLLPGYAEGFFGGAAFLLAPGVLALTGKPEMLSGWQSVQTVLDRRAIRAVELTASPIYDIGSAVILTEHKK